MMPRLDTNRAAEMEVFVRVVDLGGFTAAAREFRLTPSGVSKLVSRLEGRLSARLINRSTRRLQLTPEGQAFYDRAVRVLSDIDEAEREAAAGASPRGHLRVNSNIPLGMRHVMPLVPQFLERHPEVTLDLIIRASAGLFSAPSADGPFKSEKRRSRLLRRLSRAPATARRPVF